MLRKSFLAVASALAFVASSSSPAFAAASSGVTTVTTVYGGDTVLVKFGKNINPENCSGGSDWIKLGSLDTPAKVAAFQIIMAAYLSGKTVNYRVQGCSSYPLIYSVASPDA